MSIYRADNVSRAEYEAPKLAELNDNIVNIINK